MPSLPRRLVPGVADSGASGAGMTLPLLGLGTVAFGRDWGLKYPGSSPGLPADRRLDRLLGVAQELGVTLLDTAPAYGSSEERLGRLLASRRGVFQISTKVGEASTPRGSRYDFRPAAIRSSVERSLRRLRVETLDLVFLHSSGDDPGALAGLEALSRLREEGKLRIAGASTKTVEGGLAALERGAALMLSYSSRDRSQLPVLDRAAGRAAVLIKKPLDSGHGLRESSPAEALRDAASAAAVLSVLVGTTDPEHLRANAIALMR
ncbi:MAG: aldo/keto reductase [Acidobacteriota bacterium]